MFLFVSIYWVYSFYLKDIWLVSLLNERQTKKEAPSRFATVLSICFIYWDILG